LAMVYGMVQRHGGDMKIESAPGRGTIVRMRFAAVQAGAAPFDDGEPESPVERLNLLIIDDDPILLRSVRDVLEGDGHLVWSASDGGAGVAAFETAIVQGAPFDVVITDLGMPGVDGRRVAAAIKRASHATPVILLTGWGERLRAEEETPIGVDHVLSKPPKLKELRAALARCCNQRTAIKAARA